MTVENIDIQVKTNAGNAASQFRSLSEAMKAVSNTASRAQGANNGASSSMRNVVSSAKSAASASRSAAKAIDDVTKSAKKAQSPMASFVASLKRIAFYRLLRSIIKSVTDALKEGLTTLYEFSKANNDFGGVASALDRITSAAAQMKNQLGAALGQLLVQLEPVITAIINLITKLAQAITWLVALMSGETQYMVADPVTKSWKEADKAAKAYRNTILGFDEINRLDAPSGGGGSNSDGNGGGFHYEDVGTFLPKLNDWLAGFIDDINNTIGKIGELAAALVGLPQPVVAIDYNDMATQPLNDFAVTVKKTFPLVANVIMAIQGNPLPFIKTVRSAIVNFVQDSVGSFSEWQTAYAGACATVEAESLSLADSFDFSFSGIADTIAGWVSDFQQRVAEYQAAAETAMVENSTLQSDVETTFANIKSAIDGWVSHFWEKVGEYQTASGALQTENSTLGQDVADTYNRMRNPIDNWVTNFWNKVEEYQNASGALQTENSTLLSDVNTTFENIKENIRTSIENVKGNIDTFVTETSEQWGTWAKNTAENARLAFDNIANNVYTSLTNAAENVASFVNNTASNIWSWATNTAQNIATWAGNVAENVGKTLKTAWGNFKEFMSATGQAVSGWWNENKTWAIPAAIGAAVTVAAVALAPATGGASLAGLALAADGGAFPNNGSLFVAGEAGPEIVANMGSRTGVMNVDQMEAAVANGNIGVINAVYAMANAIVTAVNSIDTDVVLDGESVADKLYRPMQNAANRYGAAMVT